MCFIEFAERLPVNCCCMCFSTCICISYLMDDCFKIAFKLIQAQGFSLMFPRIID